MTDWKLFLYEQDQLKEIESKLPKGFLTIQNSKYILLNLTYLALI